MDGISAAPSLAIPQLTGFDRPKDAKQAATQFDALLISQLLKTMRAGGWLGTDDEDADASMLEIAEEHLAQVLASQGGLGLAGLVMKGIESGPPSEASPKAAPLLVR